VEAIFAKVKPEMIKPRLKLESEDDIDEDDEDADVIVKDTYVSHDEEDDIAEFPEDEMTEDNYRTTFDIESDPDEEVSELAEYGSDE
jgi:ornithine carbamoyltransferase